MREFDPETINHRFDPKIIGLTATVNRTLVSIFGADTVDYYRYSAAERLDRAPLSMMGETSITDVRAGLRRGLDTAIALLEVAKSGLLEELEDSGGIPAATAERAPQPAAGNRKVFVVHGRDEEAKQAVARFLQQIELEPIILHEQPNRGRTVIEKFERHADVGFAVVIVTPDDVGALGEDEENLQPRARQNAIMELGYFMGALGRGKVCALKRGVVDIPSDYVGVVFTEMDQAGAWRTRLAREIDHSGIGIDFKKAAMA